MNNTLHKRNQRTRRKARIRARVTGTAERPRLAVFRSNRSMYAQLINDENGTTIVSADSRKLTDSSVRDRAFEVGKMIAAGAKEKGVTEAVFDRGGFRYQGAIAALADGAREGGLQF